MVKRHSWRTISPVRGTTFSGTLKCSSTSLMLNRESWRRTCITISPVSRLSFRTHQKPRCSVSSTKWTWCKRIRETSSSRNEMQTSGDCHCHWNQPVSGPPSGTKLSTKPGLPSSTLSSPMSKHWNNTCNTSLTS